MNEKERKKLFGALITEDGLQVVLEDIVTGEEYNMQKDGGEPDIEYLLCVRLLETMRGEKIGWSLVNSEEWRKHVLKEE